jgi:hypothetical protein
VPRATLYPYSDSHSDIDDASVTFADHYSYTFGATEPYADSYSYGYIHDGAECYANSYTYCNYSSDSNGDGAADGQCTA